MNLALYLLMCGEVPGCYGGEDEDPNAGGGEDTPADDDPDLDLDSDDLYGDPDEWVTALMQGKDIPKLKASTLRDPRIRPYIEPFRQKTAAERKAHAEKEADWKKEREGLTLRERAILARETAARAEVTDLLSRFQAVTKSQGPAGAGAGKPDAKGQGAKGEPAASTGDPRMDALEAWARDQAKATEAEAQEEMKGRIDTVNNRMKAHWGEITKLDRGPTEKTRSAAIQGILGGIDPVKVERNPEKYLEIAVGLSAHPEAAKLTQFFLANHDFLIPESRLGKDSKETVARILEYAAEHGVVTPQKEQAPVPPEVRKAQIASGHKVKPPGGKAWSMADFVNLSSEEQAGLIANDPQVAQMVRRVGVIG